MENRKREIESLKKTKRDIERLGWLFTDCVFLKLDIEHIQKNIFTMNIPLIINSCYDQKNETEKTFNKFIELIRNFETMQIVYVDDYRIFLHELHRLYDILSFLHGIKIEAIKKGIVNNDIPDTIDVLLFIRTEIMMKYHKFIALLEEFEMVKIKADEQGFEKITDCIVHAISEHALTKDE